MPKPSFTLIPRPSAGMAAKSLAIKKKIKESRHILVAAHVSPDFDAISAVLALGRMIKKRGRKVTLFISSFRTDFFDGLGGIEKITTKLPKEKVYLVFGLDHAKVERLGIQPILKRDKPFFISLDHHPRQDQGGDIQWVDTTKASTTHMLYELAKSVGLPIDQETAFLLLLGIVGDTAGLSQPNTTPEVLKVVADLIKREASLPHAQAFISEWASVAEVKAFAKVTSLAKIDYSLKLLTVSVSRSKIKRLAVDPGVIDGFANALRMIRGVEIAVLLVGEQKNWRGHLRSRAESKIDLGKLAAHFGGGGHFHASGFKSSLPAKKILTKIKELLVTHQRR